jgi:hypothetical protein
MAVLGASGPPSMSMSPLPLMPPWINNHGDAQLAAEKIALAFRHPGPIKPQDAVSRHVIVDRYVDAVAGSRKRGSAARADAYAGLWRRTTQQDEGEKMGSPPPFFPTIYRQDVPWLALFPHT